jgi:hypothetical protein
LRAVQSNAFGGVRDTTKICCIVLVRRVARGVVVLIRRVARGVIVLVRRVARGVVEGDGSPSECGSVLQIRWPVYRSAVTDGRSSGSA